MVDTLPLLATGCFSIDTNTLLTIVKDAADTPLTWTLPINYLFFKPGAYQNLIGESKDPLGGMVVG